MAQRIKSAAEIESMRQSGRVLAEAMRAVVSAVRPGISTKELSDLAGREVESLGGHPILRGYQGFPEPLCVSINDEVVHGIPSTERVLAEGDVVGLDLSVRYQGMVTDMAVTVAVGRASAEARHLLSGTQAALAAGIAQARPGNRVGDISAAIERELLRHRLGIVRDLVGHGVGFELWEEPQVPNYGRASRGAELVAGMTLAIEPMATLGRDDIGVDPDGWTIRTVDGTLAAQFEHTVLITSDAPEILTEL